MAAETPLSKANSDFTLALFKKLSGDDRTGNIFNSPFSISSALAMVMLGARGNTAMQMSEFLKTETVKDDVHSNFAKLLNELNKPDTPFTLSLANRLFGEKSYTFVEEFIAETRKYYHAELESVDFLTDAKAFQIINTWVEEKTQNKIKDLLKPDVLDSSTKLVLVNAIYFKGNWTQKFKEEFTVDAQFSVNKNDTKMVKMMHQKSKFPFASIAEINCKILEMPYEGNELSMIIFLPNEIEDETTGLEKLEKELTYDNFKEWTGSDMMGQVEVEVKLPRFKLEEAYDLNDVLIGMGMVDAFDVSLSDFSGMSPANDLVLSKVVHKAFVEVNEEGTEAAAATAAIMNTRSIVIPETFAADHPFLFFIQHKTTKTVLFSGRFCSPQ